VVLTEGSVLTEEASADADSENGYGETPTHFAAVSGHLEVARVLVKEYREREGEEIEDGVPGEWRQCLFLNFRLYFLMRFTV